MTDISKRPITAAQAEARRNNGRRYSTGPRSVEGKQASSRNAVRHGLWSKSDPVVDTGIFAEDPAAFEDLLDGLHGSFEITSPFMEQLLEGLASVLWRLRRIPAIEALVLQQADDVADRLADRGREDLEEILQAEDYLRAGGYPLEEDPYLIMLSQIHKWAGWDFGEERGVDDPAPATEAGRVALVDHLLRHRWSSWDQAADHAYAQAQELVDGNSEARLQTAIHRAKGLLTYDVLSKLNRPEAHLARERDRLIAQLRAEEDRAAIEADREEAAE
jgi:hypothetical protein